MEARKSSNTCTVSGLQAERHKKSKGQDEKVKDHLRTAHAHHTNTASKTEISGQIMNEMVNADDYFKPPVGREGEKKGGEENRGKICPFPGAE